MFPHVAKWPLGAKLCPTGNLWFRNMKGLNGNRLFTQAWTFQIGGWLLRWVTWQQSVSPSLRIWKTITTAATCLIPSVSPLPFTVASKGVLLTSCDKGRNWDAKGHITEAKVTRRGGNRTGIKIQICRSTNSILFPTLRAASSCLCRCLWRWQLDLSSTQTQGFRSRGGRWMPVGCPGSLRIRLLY